MKKIYPKHLCSGVKVYMFSTSFSKQGFLFLDCMVILCLHGFVRKYPVSSNGAGSFSFPQAMNEISSALESLLKVGTNVLDFDHPNKCVVSCCCDSNL